jgi:hypothetical protein
MKRFIVALVLTGLCTWGFAQEASIKEMTGTVQIKAPGSTVWAPAAIGAILTQNTTISTGFKSTAILLVGNSTLTVRPLTRLTLEELTSSQGNDQVALNIQTGRIRAEVAPPAGGKVNFAVRSPSATASVRGTVFDFDTINLEVNNGIVQFAGDNGRPVMVYAGGSSAVDVVSGRSAEPIETAVAELFPTPPAGSDSGAPAIQDDLIAGTQTMDFTITY